MTWLDELIQQHEDFESPLNFWRWAGLSSIAAVMGDQVWVEHWMYKVYPNIFVILHADSGLRKGPPVNMAARLVKEVGNTNIIKGRSSIQAILKDMGTSFTTPGGNIKKNSVAFIVSSEMSSSLVEDPAAAKILTDMYDRNYNEGDYKSLLKQETFTINNPTINMLSATNEAMADDFFTSTVIKGGFLARTFIIHESVRNKRNSLVFQPDHIPNYIESAKYLKELVKLKGPFKNFSSLECDDYYKHPTKVNDKIHYSCDVGKLYHSWYDDFLDTVDSQEVRDETGTLNRFGDSVIKVAMLLSLAQHPKLEITVEAMNEAIRICEQLLGNVRKATMGKNGTSSSAPLKALIVNELLTRENHIISRAMLSKKFNYHYNGPEELNNIMESFHNAGMILTEVTDGKGTMYRMPEIIVKQLREHMAGRNTKQ